MFKRTVRQYDIRHTGQDDDRHELLTALAALAQLANGTDLVNVTFESVKSDLVVVSIEETEDM